MERSTQNYDDLSGRVALVTGGSRGIGAAVARRLARDGADVAVVFRNDEEKAAAVAGDVRAAGARAVTVQADLSQPAEVVGAVDTTVTELGGVDVVVSAAGIFPNGPLADVTLDEFDHTLAVHVRAPFLAAQAAARHMGEGGRVITIGSNLAERTEAETTLYALSKSALLGMTRGLARDLGPRGISVSLVQPGNTNTDMNPADQASQADLDAIALGSYAEADDIAATVAFLAGPGGRFVTGSAVTVDGGVNA